MAGDEIAANARRDYATVALSGRKRLPKAHDEPDLLRALNFLVKVGLATIEGEAFTLQRAEHAPLELDADSTSLLSTLYDFWLAGDETEDADEILYGELGFWQHWWNMIHSGLEQGRPVKIDGIITDHEAFTKRVWVDEFDGDIVKYVQEGNLTDGRLIVPPATVDAPAEAFVEFARALGVEVRVLPSTVSFTLYNSQAAVLAEEVDGDGARRHRLTRSPAVVDPLVRLFEMQWAVAMRWEDCLRGVADILPLLAQGWTDARIATALGVSERTVSRRVAEAMEAAGVQSRFALGMAYAMSGFNGIPLRRP